jgi:hypothetical protein
VAAVERRIAPLQREHPAPLQPVHGGSEAGESLPQAGDDLVGLLLDPGGLAGLQRAVQDVVERAGVEGDDSA